MGTLFRVQKRWNQVSGFTLIEMMAAVAIIAVLVAIAVPAYQGYEARSRQAEAKISLASAYTAEAGFVVEQHHYTGCLTSIGLAQSGEGFYTVGFSSGFGGKTACLNDDLATADASILPITGVACGLRLNYLSNHSGACSGSTDTLIKAKKSADSDGVVTDQSGLPDLYPGNPGQSTYIAKTLYQIYAVGKVGFDLPDYWYVDQSKNVVSMGAGVNCASGGVAIADVYCP